MAQKKLIRITTVPVSLRKLISGQPRYMSEKGYEVIAVSSLGKELEEVAKHENVRVIPIEMSRKITPFRDIKSLTQCHKLLKKEKPQIVHTHTPKAGIVGMMAAWMAGVPIRLHTVAGLPLMEASGGKRRLLNTVERLTYRFATRVYPNSYGLRDFILSQRLCSPKKIQVIGNGSSNGIDTTFFSPEVYSVEERETLKGKLNISDSDFTFVFVGRLVKDKGINELIDAFKGLNAQNCKLLLVGPFEEELDPLTPETTKEIHSNKNIISVGWQNDVRPYLSIADALVFPSYREGFPNVVMQAGAMGLPSIVTDINGCNEIIIEGENGVIIPPKNADALLESMNYFLNNPEKVQQMAGKSREMIVSRYEQSVVWEALLKEYQRLEQEILKK